MWHTCGIPVEEEITIVGIAATVIAADFWVLCQMASLLLSWTQDVARLAQVPFTKHFAFFSTNAKPLLIGECKEVWRWCHDIRHIHSGNALHSLSKRQSVFWMASVPSGQPVVLVSIRAAAQHGTQKPMAVAVVAVISQFHHWRGSYLYVPTQKWSLMLCISNGSATF